MTKPKRPQPPAHLSQPARTWYRHVVEHYTLEPHHLHLLRLACEALDRAETARQALDEHGLVYTTGRGSLVPRPEVAIEKDSRAAFARLVRQLDLEGEVDALYRR